MKRNTQTTNRRPFPKWVQGADGRIHEEPSYTWEPCPIPGEYTIEDGRGIVAKGDIYAFDGYKHADQSEKPIPIPSDITACMFNDIKGTLDALAVVGRACMENEDTIMGKVTPPELDAYINEQVTEPFPITCKQFVRDADGNDVLVTRFLGMDYTPRDFPTCTVTRQFTYGHGVPVDITCRTRAENLVMYEIHVEHVEGDFSTDGKGDAATDGARYVQNALYRRLWKGLDGRRAD